MNAPALWIIFPGVLAVLLIPFRQWRAFAAPVAAGVAGLLALMAWMLPIGEAMAIGPFSLKIADAVSILGRSFILSDADRPLLAILYLSVGLWILGTYFVDVTDLFAPLALGMTATWVAALAVEPFLYAAMLFEVTVLLSIPLLVPIGARAGRGVFRFLTFQTFGMPFLLFTGWMLVGVEASPSDLALVVRAAVLLALGFTFMLAIFPFHSWVPMLMEEAHPYVAGFVLAMLPGLVTLFGLGFLDRYAWLRDSEVVYSILRWVGAMMVVLAGIWAAFQSHLGKMFGYGVMMELGFSFLAVSLRGQAGLESFFGMILPRGVTLLVWVIAIGRVHAVTKGRLDFSSLRGLGRANPFLSSALLLGQLSAAGLPLLAMFPMRLALFGKLAEGNAALAVVTLIGSTGLLAGALRVGTALLRPGEQPDVRPASVRREEAGAMNPETERSYDPMDVILFTGSAIVLVFLGVMPQLVYPLWARLPLMLEQLIS